MKTHPRLGGPLRSLLNDLGGAAMSRERLLRGGTLLFAVLLGLLATWLLLAEIVRPAAYSLPTDAAASLAVVDKRAAALRAASFGMFRGDLWSQAAFTYADLLWPADRPNPSRSLDDALRSVKRALSDAPDQPGAWLMLAALASRFPSIHMNSAELLKISYYTGPTAQELIPLRLSLAVQSDAFDDPEIRRFFGRDIRLMLRRGNTVGITALYSSTSPVRRPVIEQIIQQLDPSLLETLHAK
jgi:hypothetical protein